MWKLYKSIKSGLSKKEELYLFDEVSSILGKITDAEFKDALRIMYGDDFHQNRLPAEFALMFVKGVKKNNIFSFAHLIGKMQP